MLWIFGTMELRRTALEPHVSFVIVCTPQDVIQSLNLGNALLHIVDLSNTGLSTFPCLEAAYNNSTRGNIEGMFPWIRRGENRLFLVTVARRHAGSS